MKLSYNWLKEYIEFDLSPAQLAHRLTMLGLEIEGIEGDGDNAVLELSVTPNRGDCLSHIGIAREVAMFTGGKLHMPATDGFPYKTHPSTTNSWEVKITEPELCPRYTASIIRGVKIAPSPDWLVKRLKQAGINSINNVVDITNYILLAWGQPMHAFDLAHLEGEKIIVRRARNGEEFTALDDRQHKLDEKTLVISDAQKAVALGGIMGGLNSQVSGATQDILLECAHFNPVTIRYASRKLALATDSSYRFERGTDGPNLLQPLTHAINLILETAGGELQGPVIDNYPTPLPETEIYLRYARVNRLLGTRLKPQEIKDMTVSMFFTVINEDEEGITVNIPSFRQEIDREIDLVEEIARLYGYDRIPTTIPQGKLPGQTPKTELQIKDKIRYFLTSCGLWEAINFSFTSQDFCSTLNTGAQTLKLNNPLTQEMDTLRNTLLPGLLQNIAHNLNHHVYDIKLFEIGRCFWPSNVELPDEKDLLGIALTGKRSQPSWHAAPEAIGFFDLKGIVDGLLKHLGLTAWRWEKETAPHLHPGQSAALITGGDKIGQGGRLHPEKQQELDLQQDIYVWELNLKKLAHCLPEQSKVVSLPRYPATYRDLAVVVDTRTTCDQIKEVVVTNAGKFLKDIQLFDVYTGNQIAKGKKSLAFALTYQSEAGTLSEDQINLLQDKILKALQQELSASLRE